MARDLSEPCALAGTPPLPVLLVLYLVLEPEKPQGALLWPNNGSDFCYSDYITF